MVLGPSSFFLDYLYWDKARRRNVLLASTPTVEGNQVRIATCRAREYYAPMKHDNLSCTPRATSGNSMGSFSSSMLPPPDRMPLALFLLGQGKHRIDLWPAIEGLTFHSKLPQADYASFKQGLIRFHNYATFQNSSWYFVARLLG